jgi:hypothetical protein
MKTKTPPTDVIMTFLKQNGNPNLPHQIVRTDEDGELWGS